jgi:hypothetical protein
MESIFNYEVTIEYTSIKSDFSTTKSDFSTTKIRIWNKRNCSEDDLVISTPILILDQTRIECHHFWSLMSRGFYYLPLNIRRSTTDEGYRSTDSEVSLNVTSEDEDEYKLDPTHFEFDNCTGCLDRQGMTIYKTNNTWTWYPMELMMDIAKKVLERRRVGKA